MRLRRSDVEQFINLLAKNQLPGWQKTSAAYVFAREQHPVGHISTGIAKDAWNELHARGHVNSRASMNAICKYLGWARAFHEPETSVEPSPPPRDRALPTSVQQAMDSVRDMLERLGPALLDAISKTSAEAAHRAEATVAQERRGAEEKLSRTEAEIADLRAASMAAVDEFEAATSELEQTRAREAALEAERATLTRRLEEVSRAHEVDLVKLSAAEVQIATLTNAEMVLSKEVSRLEQQLKTAPSASIRGR